MENNNTFLSDWFENKISDEQLKQHISNDDSLAYQKIKNSLANFKMEETNIARHYKAIQSKIEKVKKQKSNVIPLWKYASMAASILVFLASYFYLTKETNLETGFGEKQTIILADNSEVILNSKSKLIFSNLFQFERKLVLEGEAFFQVKKGSSFVVSTKQGTVEVLGTKFNVISNATDFFEVHCYEGKVKVTSNEKVQILTQGQSIRFYNNEVENWTEIKSKFPSWLAFESSFKNTPIKQVFEKIRNQYGVEIDFPKAIENIKFTGTVTHKNINTAMKSICIPLHLEYRQIDSNQIKVENE
jgi:ferric-dicitrate binding protein FerR (iron transport regulator)